MLQTTPKLFLAPPPDRKRFLPLLSTHFDALVNLMNQRGVKIYVYELPQQFNVKWERIFTERPFRTHWDRPMQRMERKIHQWMLHHNPLRTLNPEEATIFYLPVYWVSYASAINSFCMTTVGDYTKPHTYDGPLPVGFDKD